MEYLYSHAIPLEEVRKDGCFTILPVRRHKNPDIVIEAEQQARDEWDFFIGDGTSTSTKGSENTTAGPWDSLVIPECRPELLIHFGWITQTFFFVDGKSILPILRDTIAN